MQIDVADTVLADADSPLVAVVASAGDDGAVEVAGDPGDLGTDLAGGLSSLDFSADAGETARLPRPGGGSVLVVGVGEEVTTARLREAAAITTRTARGLASAALLVPGGGDTAAWTRAAAEGAVLGAYSFDPYRSEAEEQVLATVSLHGDVDGDAASAGAIAAECATIARDLVNTPPNDKRPPALAARALELVDGTGIEATVLDDDTLRERGYGGLIAVGQGSAEGPRLVELTWAPDDATGDHVALVGKGITFDTGGISLKPSSSMETMKMDMGGAATVLAAILAVARLGLPRRVTALLCLAENMPSATAQRVSDVYTALDGSTVEVMNTDAEGRLVLADGIVHAARAGADVVVDVATLTGAAVISLGAEFTFLMADDDAVADGLVAAGLAADEPMWRMPLGTEQFADKLESTVADRKNVGGREAGSITAGLFLHSFVPDGVRWGHLDIAGTAWSDKGDAVRSKGGTGTPVRALVHWLDGLG